MKKTLFAIAASILLASLSACGAEPESGVENNLTDTAENRFLSYDFGTVSSPVKLNEAAAPVRSEMPEAYRFADYIEPKSVRDIMRNVTQVGVITVTGAEPFRNLTGGFRA